MTKKELNSFLNEFKKVLEAAENGEFGEIDVSDDLGEFYDDLYRFANPDEDPDD